MRACVLLHWDVALVFWEDLPVIFLGLIIKTERDTGVVGIPDTDDIVSGHIVYSPMGHVVFSREHPRREPLLSGQGVLKVVV